MAKYKKNTREIVIKAKSFVDDFKRISFSVKNKISQKSQII